MATRLVHHVRYWVYPKDGMVYAVYSISQKERLERDGYNLTEMVGERPCWETRPHENPIFGRVVPCYMCEGKSPDIMVGREYIPV